jgi:hypothetical protein
MDHLDCGRVPSAGLRGSTKPSRELRLVLDQQRSVWVERKKELELIQLPIDDNHVLIYQDQGVYEGQRLGTPCDEFAVAE